MSGASHSASVNFAATSQADDRKPMTAEEQRRATAEALAFFATLGPVPRK